MSNDSIEAKLKQALEDADYAWRNVRILEKARQEEMDKRDIAEAKLKQLKDAYLNSLEAKKWPCTCSGFVLQYEGKCRCPRGRAIEKAKSALLATCQKICQ